MIRFVIPICATLLGAFSALAQDQSAAQNPLATVMVPHFVEQAEQASMEHIYAGGWEFFVGGGAAGFDCNLDHKPDLAIAGGTNQAQLFVNQSAVGGDLNFSAQPLLDDERLMQNVSGIYPINIDGDAHDDLVLLRLGENLVLRGTGNCQFERADRNWQIDGGHHWTTAFAANWEEGQTFPTLAFGNYVDLTAPGSPWGTCADSYLFRPATDEGLPDYSNALDLSPGYCTLSMLFSDWNRSGEPALRVTNDRQYYRGGEEQLWQISPNRRPRLYRRADGWEFLKIWGMGIAQADLNSDGIPEYALTSMGDTKLQVLEDPTDPSRPAYLDEAFERGVTAAQPYAGPDKLPSTGWHSQFMDFNNDGLLDLYIAKGNVEAMPDFASFDPDNLLLQQRDGSFVEAGEQSGIGLPTGGRGAVIADFNMDGLLDMLVVNRKSNVSLFRNLGRQTDFGHASLGNWVELELRDSGSNVDAIGARVLIKTGTITMSRTVQIGGGHASGYLGSVHVGLGLLDRATVRVQWPDGTWSHDYRFLANQHVVIERNSPDVTYRAFVD